MHKIDFERAALLIGIIEKQANTVPLMSSLAGEASQELKEINELAKQNADERANEIRKKEQIAIQKDLQAHEEANRTDSEIRDQSPYPPANNPAYVPGQPVNLPQDRASPTDKNADGIDDSWQGGEPGFDYRNESGEVPAPEVERRV